MIRIRDLQYPLTRGIQVLQSLGRGVLHHRERMPWGGRGDPLLQRMHQHHPGQLGPLRRLQVEGVSRWIDILGHRLPQRTRPERGRQHRSVLDVALDHRALRRRGGMEVRILRVIVGDRVGGEQSGKDPVVRRILQHGQLVERLLGRDGIRHVRVLADVLLRQLEDRAKFLGVLLRAELGAQLLLLLQPNHVQHRRRGQRLDRPIRLGDVNRHSVGPGVLHTGQRSEGSDQLSGPHHRPRRQLVCLLSGLNRVQRRRGHRRRQVRRVLEHREPSSGTIQHGGVQRLRLAGVTEQICAEGVAVDQLGQRPRREEPLLHTATRHRVVNRREEHRPQQRTVLHLVPQLHDGLGRQAGPVDRVAGIVHQLHRVDELRRVLQELRQRPGTDRRHPRLLRGAELPHEVQHLERAQRLDVGGCNALVDGSRQPQQVSGHHFVHRGRRERRLELQREPKPGTQRIEHALQRRVLADALLLIRYRITQLLVRQPILLLPLALPLHVGDELAGLPVELGDRSAGLRGREHRGQLALPGSRVDLGDIGVPRQVRGLHTAQTVVLIVHERQELRQRLRLRQRLVERGSIQHPIPLSQPVHQQVPAVLHVVEAAAPRRSVLIHLRAQSIPFRQQHPAPEDELGLSRVVRHQRVDQERRRGAGDRVDRHHRSVVGQHREVAIRNLLVRVQQLDPVIPVLPVEALVLLDLLPDLGDTALEVPRVQSLGLPQPATELLVRGLVAVVGQLLVRGTDDRIHHRLVRGDQRDRAILRDLERHVVLAGFGVLRHVRGVPVQHLRRHLLAVRVLVHQLRVHLRDRLVPAEHVTVDADDVVQRVRAEHLHERLVGVGGAEPGMLRLHRIREHRVLPLDGLELLAQEPLGHRLHPLLGQLAVRTRHQPRNPHVRQHRQRHVARPGLTLQHPQERLQPAGHVPRDIVDGVQHLDPGVHHRRVQRRVGLRHLHEHTAHALTDRLLVRPVRGVVQALPRAEHRLASEQHPLSLRGGRSSRRPESTDSGLRLHHVVGRRLDHVLDAVGVRRRHTHLQRPQLLPQTGVDLGVHRLPTLPAVGQHLVLELGCEHVEELRTRIRVTQCQVIQERLDSRVRTPTRQLLSQERPHVRDDGLALGAGRALRLTQSRAQHTDAARLDRGHRHVHRAMTFATGLHRPQVRTRTDRPEHLRIHHHLRQVHQLVAVEVHAVAGRPRQRNLNQIVSGTQPSPVTIVAGHRQFQPHLRQQPHHRGRVVHRWTHHQGRHRLCGRQVGRVVATQLPARLQPPVQPEQFVALNRRIIAVVERPLDSTHLPQDPLALLQHSSQLCPLLIGAGHLDRLRQRLRRRSSELLQSVHRQHHRAVMPPRRQLRHHRRLIRSRVRGLLLRRHQPGRRRQLALRHRFGHQHLMEHLPTQLLGHRSKHLRHVRVPSRDRLTLRLGQLIPLLPRQRLTQLTHDHLRLVVVLRLALRPHPGTDRHAGAHRKPLQRGVPDLTPVHRLVVGDRLEHRLDGFLSTFTPAVDQRRRHHLRISRQVHSFTINLIWCQRSLLARTTRHQRRDTNRPVLHELARRQRRRSHPGLHRVPRSIQLKLPARQRLRTRPASSRSSRSPRARQPGELAPLAAAAHRTCRRTQPSGQPELRDINADKPQASSTRRQVEVALLVEEDVVELGRPVRERLTTRERQLTNLAGDHRPHLELERPHPGASGELTNRRQQHTAHVGGRPRNAALQLTRLIRLVVGRLTVTLGAPTHSFGISEAVDQVPERVHLLCSQPRPGLQRGRALREDGSRLSRHLLLHLPAGVLVLDLVAVHPRSDPTNRSTRSGADAGTDRTKDRAQAGTRQRATRNTRADRPRIGSALIPGILLRVDLLAELLLLPVVPRIIPAARSPNLSRVGSRLLALLIDGGALQLLHRVHHERAHHIVGELLPVGVVEVLHLPTTTEHVTELDPVLFVIPQRNPVPLLAEPVDRRLIVLLQRLAVALVEVGDELVVPAVAL